MPPRPVVKDQRLWPLDGQRILVVEDNAHTAALVRQALLAAGAFEVVVAGDGRQALAQLASMRPDVLVTDLMMPVVGGMELIRAVRQAALAPDANVPDPTIPIVMVSAFGTRQAVRLAQAAGIDAFVVKPFSLGSLVKRVDRAGRRTLPFVVDTDYVGPERRTGTGQGARRATDAPTDAAPTASQLKALYARIKEMENERVGESAA
jgi:CheY-like chemotaxis protein